MLYASLPTSANERTQSTAKPVSVAVIGGGLAGHQIVHALTRRGIQPTVFDDVGVRLPMYALSPQVALNVTPESRLSLLGTQFTNNHLNVQRIGLRRQMPGGRRQRVLTSLHPDVASDTGHGLMYPYGGFLFSRDLFMSEADSQDNRLQHARVLAVDERSDGVAVTFQPTGSRSTRVEGFE